jgi:hypothetical protein
VNADESPPIDATEKGHEPIGVSVRFVVVGVAGLITLIVLTLFGMGGIVRLLSYGAKEQPDGPPSAKSARTVGLGLNQAHQREAMEVQQEKWLSEYAWLDQDQQTARIPIARAIQIIADRGIGVVTAPGSEPASTQDTPDPSNEDRP